MLKITDQKLKSEGEKIEEFLSRSFDSVSVEHVPSDVVTARTTIGFDAEEARDKYQAYYRVEVNSETKDDVMETRGEVTQHFRDQLLSMEQNSPAPDTQLVETDFPPRNVKKSLVFYVRSTF